MKKKRSSQPNSQGFSLPRPIGAREQREDQRPWERGNARISQFVVIVRNNNQIFPIRIRGGRKGWR